MRIRKRFEQLKETIERANPLSRKERIRQEEQEQIDTSQQEGETLSEERSDKHFGRGEDDLEIGEERRIWSDEGELEIGEERHIRNDSVEELSDDLEKGRNEGKRNSDR